MKLHLFLLFVLSSLELCIGCRTETARPANSSPTSGPSGLEEVDIVARGME
jgi:hypothetical protein